MEGFVYNLSLGESMLFLFSVLLIILIKTKFKPIKWWRGRWIRRINKALPHLDYNRQVDFARSLLANVAIQIPRENRRKFLKVQWDMLGELVKFGTEQKAKDTMGKGD